MKKITIAVALSAATIGAVPAFAAPVISYDITNGRANGYGNWSNSYSGQTVTTGATTNFTGGSGTLNDGITPNSLGNNQLFSTADNTIITTHFASTQTFSEVAFLNAYAGNTIPGNITAAVLTIGGVSQRIEAAAFGAVNPGNGYQFNQRFTITGLLAAAIGDTLTISRIETKGNIPQFYAIGEITVASVAAAVPEPATWAMMLVGFAMVGATARYRRRSTTAAFA